MHCRIFNLLSIYNSVLIHPWILLFEILTLYIFLSLWIYNFTVKLLTNYMLWKFSRWYSPLYGIRMTCFCCHTTASESIAPITWTSEANLRILVHLKWNNLRHNIWRIPAVNYCCKELHFRWWQMILDAFRYYFLT